MRKAFAIWLMAGLPVLADSVAATRSWVSNRVAEARAEWRGDVAAATNPVPSWISAAEGRMDGRIAGATNGLPERIAAVTNGLPERIASVTNGLPAKIAAVTNGIPAKIAAVTNGLPEAIAASTNGLPEQIVSVTNGLPERIAAATNGLPEAIAAATNGIPRLIASSTNGVMGEVNAATGALWRAIGNIEGVTADIGELARTNDLPTKVSQLENDAGYLTNHVDVSNLARAAGVFPDWTSKGMWSEGEFCTWKGVVYRFTGAGDPSAQPDISPASWAVSDVGTAIAEARPDMSSLTNPIPSWIAASTNGLPEAIAAATNGLPAKIAAVTNGLPERIAAVTNGLPEQIASVTNGLPEAIVASTNGVVERATEAAIGAVAGLDAKTAYRLSGPPPYDRSWIDGTGAVYEAHAAPLIVSNGVTWTRLRNDRVFPTAAESLALSSDELTWTNGVDEIATWGQPWAQDLDGNVYGDDGYPERVFFTKHMTFADIDPDPTWVAYGYTQHLGTYLWGWTSARLTVIYGSPYMPSGVAETELHFVTAAVKTASNTYVASLVSASTNATNAVVSVNVTGFPLATLTTGLTRTLTLPRTVTFRPDAVPVKVDEIAKASRVVSEDGIRALATETVRDRGTEWTFRWFDGGVRDGVPDWSFVGYSDGEDGMQPGYEFYDNYGGAGYVISDTTPGRTRFFIADDLGNTVVATRTNPHGFALSSNLDDDYLTRREALTGFTRWECMPASKADGARYYVEYDWKDGELHLLSKVPGDAGIPTLDEWMAFTAPQNMHLTNVTFSASGVTAVRRKIGGGMDTSITNGLLSVSFTNELKSVVANVATQVLYTSTTEIYDTWHVPEYEGYSDLAYRAVWSNGRWYGFTINAEDGYGDLFISSGAGNANATTVTMSDAYGSVTWNRTGTATNDVPVYDIVGRQYDYMSGMTYVDGPTGDWFDIQTNSWHVWIADHAYYSPFVGTNVRDCRIFETANPTNWTPVTGLIRIPEGAASITGTVTWAYIDASHYTNVQVVLTPRSLNALGLARFSDLDRYAVPRQRLTEEVRRAVNLAADYLWDPLDEVCYRRQMSGGFLDYVAVTNIDVTLPENWQALEALEAERRSQQ